MLNTLFAPTCFQGGCRSQSSKLRTESENSQAFAGRTLPFCRTATACGPWPRRTRSSRSAPCCTCAGGVPRRAWWGGALSALLPPSGVLGLTHKVRRSPGRRGGSQRGRPRRRPCVVGCGRQRRNHGGRPRRMGQRNAAIELRGMRKTFRSRRSRCCCCPHRDKPFHAVDRVVYAVEKVRRRRPPVRVLPPRATPPSRPARIAPSQFDLQPLQPPPRSRLRRIQTFCLLGHNGAGKTTTFDCLVGNHSIDGVRSYFAALCRERARSTRHGLPRAPRLTRSLSSRRARPPSTGTP